MSAFIAQYRWPVVALVAASALILSGACADAEVLRPAPTFSTSSASSGSGGAAGSGGGHSFTPRTVIVRDPLGAVHKTRNLLWDGDFEWLPSFQDQYGWLYGPNPQQLSFALPPLVMGARCKSGVKCTRLPSNGALLGLAVASLGNPLAVSVWSAPEDGVCGNVNVYLLTQSNFQLSATIAPVTDAADADGWCQHSGLVPERDSALYLYIENGSSPAIIDDASIEPADSDAQQAASGQASPSKQLSAETAMRIQAWARAAAEPRIAPPSEGQRRFQQHMHRRFGARK